jgi:lipopolysaccharide transport system permease protein
MQRLHLILSFAQRDIRARYKQTVFGAGWAVLQPFSLMIVFTMVFSTFAKIPSEGLPYPLFSYSALIFWTFFSTSISQGTTSMVANANLIRRIYFPRETLLLAALVSTGFDLGIAATIFAGMMGYYQIPLASTALWVAPLLLIQLVLTLGVISLTSVLNVYFRDIGRALPLLLQLWMFATPAAYPLDLVPARLRPLYLLNPMVSIIDGYRRVLLHGDAPDLGGIALAGAMALLLAGAGFAVFKRAQRTFADVI